MNSIKSIREDVISSLITQKYSNTLTKEEIKRKIQTALSLISSDENTITNIRTQSDMTNAEDIRNTTQELFVDLNTAMEYLNRISSEQLGELNNLLSNLSRREKDIEKLNNIIDEYNFSIISKGNPILIQDDFIDNSTFEHDNSYFTTRYGEETSQITSSVYCGECFNLRLPKLRRTNIAYYGNGILAADISLSKQYSSIDKDNKEYSLNDIINTDNNLIWKQDIYTNQEIKLKESNDYYNLSRGALFELEINFESVSVINEIQISNISEYPLDILNIRYKLIDSEFDDYVNVVSNNSSSEYLKPKTFKNSICYKFKNIMAKKVYITFCQRHFEREGFTYNVTDKLISDFKNSIKNSQLENKNTDIFKANYEDFKKDYPAISYIKNLVDNNKDMSIDELLKCTNLGEKDVIKYHYSYGLSKLELLNNEFDTIGIYVSKPKKLPNNINKIKIVTDEEHPLNEEGNVITDIEYYICYTENTSYNNWHPILPENNNKIYCESLELNDDAYCNLRFHALEDDIVSVKINGMIMEKYLDYTLHKDNVTGEVIGIEIPDYDIKSVYTIEYTPLSNSKIIDLSNIPLVTDSEELNGNNKSRFILSQNIAVSNILDVRITLYDIKTGNSFDVENVTDKYNADDSFINFNNKGKWQCYCYKNNIFLNNNVPDNYKVKVQYQHNINSFRVKAILKRNSKFNKYITPVLNNIKYEITVG